MQAGRSGGSALTIVERPPIQGHVTLASIRGIFVPHIHAYVAVSNMGVHGAVLAAVYQDGAAVLLQKIVQVLQEQACIDSVLCWYGERFCKRMPTTARHTHRYQISKGKHTA